ncbi:LuxE/PaaK family acyltransferase [Ulvibacter litoralis]|uniref:Acyl-protein synthetase, LuxE n=1 Tax=Ulvibacter litoralis TaxID=227084 RepID=A0A1G7CRC6_9FLAO|nr:acyl transferase [Ulvibacter litoralis]GHC46371.1 acyltransferase [Ulvibacter litoralis]SDE41849.1 Acyl-protein synthetase, LuxE [Ulvibacter litoralis]
MLEKDIFTITSSEDFEIQTLKVFQYQYKNIAVYRQFCDLLNVHPSEVKTVTDIPFLPIQFFKSHSIIAEGLSPKTTFTSSGTTGAITSKHLVANVDLYEKSFTEGFLRTYGNPSEYTILALLPSYLERDGSSLIYMVADLIKKSDNPHSGFYLNDTDALIEKLTELEKNNQKTILLGVSYALLDLIEKQTFQLKNTLIMETGGMKGKRKELIKYELHDLLKIGFGVSEIHSEYGMTELLSQAYSKGNGVFTCPPWMKIYTRDTEDALSYTQGNTGGINVVDLANLYSCAFIATQDLGKCYDDGSFEIIGRFDASDIRGCNLMVL